MPLDTGHAMAPSDASLDVAFGLLGILIIDSSRLDDLDPKPHPDHFDDAVLAEIMRRIASMHARGLAADIASLDAEMRVSRHRKSYADDFGGAAFLADLVRTCPPATAARGLSRSLIETSNRRRLLALGQEIAKLAGAEGDDVEDADSAAIVDLIDRELLGLQRADGSLDTTDLDAAADETLEYVDDRDSKSGLHCGLLPLHDLIGPLLPGELYLLPGRPSMGKSAVAAHLALRVAAPEWWRALEMRDNLDAFETDEALARQYGLSLPGAAGVIEISGEMDRKQIMRRHFADVGFALHGPSFPTFRQIRDRHVDASQRAMMNDVRDAMRGWPISIIKRAGLHVSEIRSIVRRQVAKWNRAGVRPGLVIFDHAGTAEPEGKTSGQYEGQTQIAKGLQRLAFELQLPVLALIQLSRKVEERDDKRPRSDDLRDSGAWEEAADVIVFPFRESHYATKEREPDRHKDNGASWADWDARCRSRALEFIPGKVREGAAGRSTKAWAAIEWNAIRSVSPPDGKGGLL